MDYISPNDIYEIRLASLVSNVDKDVIIELYQPLVGYTASILYLTLLKQKRNESEDEFVFTHDNLMTLMQIVPGNLLTARHALEGVGLLRTYEKVDGNNRFFVYVLYAPKTPKEFFEDVLFKGLLIQSLGEKEVRRLASHYQVDLSIDPDYKEVSASFIDVFNPNYDDPSFRKNVGQGAVGHTVGRVKIQFSYDLFFKYVEGHSQFAKESFTKKDMNEIERITTLFGLDETTMASIIIDTFNPNSTPHFNSSEVIERAKDSIKYPFLTKKTVRSKVNSDTILSKKIKMMDDTSPIDWLKLLQRNTKLASSDISIIDSLSSNYGFSNGVINAIIDYVLTKNNNVLSRNYCEKIASSLAREDIETTIDAMNYLNKITIGTRGRKVLAQEEVKPIEKETPKNEDISDEEMDEILASIKKQKVGGKK
ncbi:MAG: DnaD domain protein [Bacilli bacterium]|nr:DnaD domain protein [Bacilli bacterium]